MPKSEICHCSQCRGRFEPVHVRTIQRHSAADREREIQHEEEVQRVTRAPSPPFSPSKSNIDHARLPSPPAQRHHRKRRKLPSPVSLQPILTPVERVGVDFDTSQDVRVGNEGSSREDSEHSEDGEMDGEGADTFRERREAEDAADRIAAAVMENLHLGNRVVGDGNGIEGGDGREEAGQPTDSNIEDIRITNQFIELLRTATLDNSGLDSATIDRLRNPLESPVEELDAFTRLSIDMFLSITHASEATYRNIRKAIIRCFPDSNILSYHEVKKLVQDTTGVVSVYHDMCINSCLAYTGPFKDLDECRYCKEPRYDQEQLRRRGEKVARQQFGTILLGPQLAAIRRSEEGATARLYRTQKLEQISKMIESLDNPADMVYDDIWCGQDLRDLAERSEMAEDDVAVCMSLDGAQLYQNKKSDCWIGIWINQDYAPSSRFKKKRILPNVTIPGPNKPKHTDSFLFPGLLHVAALQHENDGKGLRVWDAVKHEVVHQRLFFLLALADAVGLPELDGRVTHHGAQGCRLGCTMKGRHKPSSGHYYAAHAKPLHCTVWDNLHDDVEIEALETQTAEEYDKKIAQLRLSSGPTDYIQNRKDTGLSKPSILLGLDPNLSLQVPRCFALDLMHLLLLNLEDLFICLWRGTLKCESLFSQNFPSASQYNPTMHQGASYQRLQLIQSATAEELCFSGNMPYNELRNQNMQLSADLHAARTLTHTLQGLLTSNAASIASSSLPSAPSTSLPSSSSSSLRFHMLPKIDYIFDSLSPDDCASIKFFSEQAWKIYQGRKANTGTQPNPLSFLQRADGTYSILDSVRMAQIQNHSRSVLNAFYKYYCDPETWGKATSDVVDYYCRSMASEFEEFRYSDQTRWKAKHYATIKFPDWNRFQREPGNLQRFDKNESKKRKAVEPASPSSGTRKKKKSSNGKLNVSRLDSSTAVPPQTPLPLSNDSASIIPSPDISVSTPESNEAIGDITSPLPQLITQDSPSESPSVSTDAVPVVITGPSTPPGPSSDVTSMDPGTTLTMPNPDDDTSSTDTAPTPPSKIFTSNSSLDVLAHAAYAVSSTAATDISTATQDAASASTSSVADSPTDVFTSSSSSVDSNSLPTKVVNPLAGFVVNRTIALLAPAAFSTSIGSKASRKGVKEEKLHSVEDVDKITARNLFALEYLKTNQPTKLAFTQAWQNASADAAEKKASHKWASKERELKSRFGKSGTMKDVKGLPESH